MNWVAIREGLRTILCELYGSDDRIRLVLDDSGIRPGGLEWGSSTETTWHKILSSLHASRRLGPLLETIERREVGRPDLRNLTEAYRILPDGDVLGLPKALLGPGHDPGLSLPAASPSTSIPSLNPEQLGLLAGILAQAQGINPAMFRAAPVILLDPPPLPDRLVRRTAALDTLIPLVERGTFTVILGDACTGKTVLARLAADQLGHFRFWIRMAGVEGERAAAEFDRAISGIAGSPPGPSRQSWFVFACQRIGDCGLVVIDDLPQLDAGDPLWQRLEPFLSQCRRSGIRVLATATKPLPPSVRGLFAEGSLRVFPIPPLDVNEASEMLSRWGAPEDFVVRSAHFVHLSCRQHPFLMAAASDYLRRKGWQLGDEEFSAIVGAGYADSLDDDVEHRLRATVRDPKTRELLYRLSIIGGRFTAEFADALAKVAKELDRPRERMSDLRGPWVRDLGGGEFEVSPLLSRIGKKHLPRQRLVNCHRRIGLTIIRSRFDQHRAALAITHFISAGEFDRAGSLYATVLAAASHETRHLPDDPVFWLWANAPLPGEMDLNHRLVIRGLQVAISRRLGKPIGYLIDDLDALSAGASGAHRFGLAAAASYIAMAVDASTMPRACSIVRKLLKLPNGHNRPRRRAKSERDSSLVLSPDFPTEGLVFMLIVGIATPEDLLDWLDTFLVMPEELRQRLFRFGGGPKYFSSPGDFLVSAERNKAEGRRDWVVVIAALDEFGRRAREAGCEEIWASALRVRMGVLANQVGRIDDAVATAQEALDRGVANPLVRLLVAGGIGELLVDARRFAEARAFLDEAFEGEVPSQFEAMTAMLAASHAFGEVDGIAAVSWAERAVAVAGNLREIAPLEEVKALAELGIAQFLQGGARSAFSAWERAAGRLLEVRSDTAAWKELFVLFGHMTGYLSQLASSGSPPSKTGEGEEYAPPGRGMFLTINRGRLEYYREDNILALPYLVMFYATAAGQPERAAAWRGRFAASDAVKELPTLRAGMHREAIPDLVAAGHVVRAIHLGRDAARIMVALSSEEMRDRPATYRDPELDVTAAELTGENIQQAESLAVMLGVVPAAIFAATLYIREQDRPEAEAYARRLIEACRSEAGEAASDALRNYWQGIAEPIEQAFVERKSYAELSRWRQSQGQLKAEREALTFLAMAANATVEEAIGVHVPILRDLERWYKPGTAVHHDLLLPYVEKYWMEGFARMRFRFSKPALVEQLLPDALQAPQERRLRAILRAVVAGFRSNLPEELANWLYERPS